MNKVDFLAKGVAMPVWKGNAGKYIRNALKILGHNNWELCVLFCNDEYIKSLNADFRSRNEATDILTFNIGETTHDGNGKEYFLAGDIVISLEMLKTNADYFNVPEDQELRRLLIHGILHLDGMDHATNKPSEPMLKLQEEILLKAGGEIFE